MEDQAFIDAIRMRRVVAEKASYLEMLSYSDSALNSVKEGPLVGDEVEDFIHQRVAFSPTIPNEGAHPVAGIRLILQLEAKDGRTFAPDAICMKPEAYVTMMEILHLPRIAIESSSVVGPFFWYAVENGGSAPLLQMIFRKSDVRKRGTTKGWELILSHEIATGITTGFCKGTTTSGLRECIGKLKACISDLGHAMLLPMIMFNQVSSSQNDLRQRDTRDWLRRLESTISIRNAKDEYHSFLRLTDLHAIDKDLVACHARVLWFRPIAYLEVLGSIEEARGLFKEALPSHRKTPAIEKFHNEMGIRLMFLKKRWQGLEVYGNTTIQRLEIQRNALHNFIAQKEGRLNLEMAADQRRLAYTSKRESEAMKGISLLGTIFLPGAFIASIFSTTFFNFADATDWASVVSPRFWLYWAVTVPITAIIVGLYFAWQKRRARIYEMEDAYIEESVREMERRIG